MVGIATKDEEVSVWKQALPAMVEGCRNWTHRDDCEYLVRGESPLTINIMEVPICQCGMGKDVEEFTSKFRWKQLVPYITRMVISPMFAVSYLQSVGAVLNYNPPLTRPASHADPTLDRCTKCGRGGNPKLLVCSRCKRAGYCSKICQKQDWKLHKAVCEVV